jgi:HD-GYP domain-containing protein (c-di-GMP phosphodiesterase class II)
VTLRFGQRLRDAIQFGPRAVDDLIRSFDPSLADHHRRVAQLAVTIGREMGLSRSSVTGIELASSIHDIGVIGAVEDLDGIRATGGPGHPSAGTSIVEGVHFPWPIETMILQHHEHLDGSGYPNGLRRDKILFASRVITVADTVVTSSEAGMPSSAVVDQLRSGCDARLDREVVDACLAVLSRPLVRDGVVEPLVS